MRGCTNRSGTAIESSCASAASGSRQSARTASTDGALAVAQRCRANGDRCRRHPRRRDHRPRRRRTPFVPARRPPGSATCVRRLRRARDRRQGAVQHAVAGPSHSARRTRHAHAAVVDHPGHRRRRRPDGSHDGERVRGHHRQAHRLHLPAGPAHPLMDQGQAPTRTGSRDGGYLLGEGNRSTSFGSLLVGVYERRSCDSPVRSARASTSARCEVQDRLAELHSDKCPFDPVPKLPGGRPDGPGPSSSSKSGSPNGRKRQHAPPRLPGRPRRQGPTRVIREPG